MDHGDVLAAELTPAAQKFLRDHINSIWQLELILYLKEIGSPLSIVEIARHLYTNTGMIEAALTAFVKDGILKEGGSQPIVYAYGPSTTELIEAIEQAKKAYSDKRLSVINFIFSQRDGDHKQA